MEETQNDLIARLSNKDPKDLDTEELKQGFETLHEAYLFSQEVQTQCQTMRDAYARELLMRGCNVVNSYRFMLKRHNSVPEGYEDEDTQAIKELEGRIAILQNELKAKKRNQLLRCEIQGIQNRKTVVSVRDA